MAGVVPTEDELRAILDGTLTNIRVGKAVRRGDLVVVREACNDVHPLSIPPGRYSQPGRAGIDGPPPVSFRTVYRIDGPLLTIWSKQDWPYWTRDAAERKCMLCTSDDACKFPSMCSNKRCYDGTADAWTPARFAGEWTSRIFLDVLHVDGQLAEVRPIWRRDLMTAAERRAFETMPIMP